MRRVIFEPVETTSTPNSNPIAPTIGSTTYEPCDPLRNPIANSLSATLLLAAVNSASNVVLEVSIVAGGILKQMVSWAGYSSFSISLTLSAVATASSLV